MELIYTARGPPDADEDAGGDIQQRWLHASCRTGLSQISSRNVLLFTTTAPHPASGSDSGSRGCRFLHRVFVCDLNTPWDLHLVTARSAEVTSVAWDESGSFFALSDADGNLELWKSGDHLLSQWRRVASERLQREAFVEAKFVYRGRRVHLNTDKRDSVDYNDKFTFSPGPKVGAPFGLKGVVACVFVSTTSLAACLAYRTQDNSHRMASRSLAGNRSRIKHAAMTFMEDGKLVVAVTNGMPNHAVQCFQLLPEMMQDGDITLDVVEYPPVFLDSRRKSDGAGPSEEVVALSFVKDDASDALLVASRHPSGGRVELWELKTHWQPTHKLFTSSGGEGASNGTVTTKVQTWQYVESFTGPAPSVLALATPPVSLQAGPDAPCYVVAAYGDGSLQCLLRDSLQQVGSAEVPNLSDDDPSRGRAECAGSPSKKRARPSGVSAPPVCSVSFSATGNALVVVDALGRLRAYRVSPISDPGGAHTVPFLVTMLEYCLVSGRDCWDVTACARAGHVEAACERLAENFGRQQPSVRAYYETRFTSLQLWLRRLCPGGEAAACDYMIRLLLSSVVGACKTMLRTCEASAALSSAEGKESKITYEKIEELLRRNKDEVEVDNFVKMLQSPAHAQKDLLLDAATVHSIQHLLQWTVKLALHVVAGVPDFKQGRRGPGFDIFRDPDELATLRQLLLLIRLWGNTKLSCRPVFTKTGESFDVVAKLFAMVTKLKETPNDESFQDDCLRLPSQLMIPPLNVQIRSRGVCPVLVSGGGGGGGGGGAVAVRSQGHHVEYEFGMEPETEATMAEAVFVEGAMANDQIVDCVRQMYLGKNPYSAKQCTRCHSMTLYQEGALSNRPSSSHPGSMSWESRWIRNCPCGGNWKIKHFD